MVFILHTAKFCRSIPCLSLSKSLIVIAHPNIGKHAAAEIILGGSHKYSTDLKNDQNHRATLCQPIINPRDKCVTLPQTIFPNVEKETQPRAQVVEQSSTPSEWANIEVDKSKLHKYCLMLSKIRLTSLVVITTMGGYALAPGPFDISTFFMCSLGTGLVSATANAVNQFFEVPFDAQMSRTKNRVLVRGYLNPVHAVAFAVVSGTVGLSILYCGVNGVTATLGATNLILYTLIYTPLKRISILNTWVGSVVGAIPPLMGWAGCVGSIMDPGAWIMSGILYAWQFPHFNALSWNLRPDYSRAGYRMMAVTNPSLCRKTALRYTAALAGLCYLAPILDVTNWWFAVTTTPLNAYFLYLAWQFNSNSDSGTSRKLFRFSLVHLPALMILMLLTKKHWFSNKTHADSPTTHERGTDDVVTTITKLIMSTSPSI